VSTRAQDVSNFTAALARVLPPTASAPANAPLAPNLKMYRSEAGFNAIMGWYEDTQDTIVVGARHGIENV
jgi:hypothetical protein